jgi:arylsulfatase A-like enzyme
VRPNVLLVVMDTARADAFEPFGAPRGATPAVAQLAAGGATSRTAVATSNWTLPSHASLFSGALPRAMGLGCDGARPRDVLAANADRLLAVALARAGWATGAISTNPWVSSIHGFGLGFGEFVDVRQRRHAPGDGVRGRVEWLADAVRADLDAGMADVDEVLERWLASRAADEPFFWFVNLMECHSPYLPPLPYNDLGPFGRLRAGHEAGRYQSHRGFVLSCLGELDLPDGARERMRHLYARSVLSMDDWLARLLERLDGAGVLEDTLVVVTSDHGENLGEGGMLGHALSLDDRLIQVPVVAYGPGSEAFAGVASLADVPRAVAAAVGLEDHPWQVPACPDGILLSEVDGLATVDPNMAQKVVDEWHLPARAVQRLTEPLTCAVEGGFKLVRRGAVDTLHDLDADPLEQVDASARHPDVAARLRAALEAATPPPAEAAGQPVLAPDADLEERLRLLGYL